MSAKRSNGRKRNTRSVGRPRKSDNASSESPSEGILKVAAKLFSSKGYAGTTMAEIADEVGIRSPSLYYHFREKADILRALADIGLASTMKAADIVQAESSLSPAARLHLLTQIQIVTLRSSEYELNCLFDPVFHDKEFSDINKQLASWMKTQEGYIRDGVKSGQLEIDDLELAGYTLRGIIALSVRELGRFTRLGPDQIARYLADAALAGFVTSKSTLKSIHKELESHSLGD